MIQIYHNSRCGKSRECLVFLEKSGQEYEIINYLKDIPSFDELKEIINKLAIKPMELVRRKEKIWIENFKDKPLSDDKIIQAMISNPILIERPIVINGNKAIIARPLEKVMVILK
jgi:arsenate reductase